MMMTTTMKMVYQESGDAGEDDGGEAAQEGVGKKGADERGEVGCAVPDVGEVSSSNRAHVVLLHQINSQVRHHAEARHSLERLVPCSELSQSLAQMAS